jgi:hypothetical protein
MGGIWLWMKVFSLGLRRRRVLGRSAVVRSRMMSVGDRLLGWLLGDRQGWVVRASQENLGRQVVPEEKLLR